MSEPAIEFDAFGKTYGAHEAVQNLTLSVARAGVCGFLGKNGAGKTTSIRCLLDLLRPTSGAIRVLGLDSVEESVAIRARVGYLPEEPTYYPWMRVGELLRFNAGFFAGWDEQLAAHLLGRLELPTDRRMRDLSRGMQAKVGLVMALAQKPDVLVLDDPTSGLDPTARRDFLEAMIATVQNEGGTVFFSTHLIHEMERVADQVAILHEGRLLVDGSVDDLKAACRKIRVVHDAPPGSLPAACALRVLETQPHTSLLYTDAFNEDTPRRLVEIGLGVVEVLPMDLEEVYVHAVRGAADPSLPGSRVTAAA